MNRPRILITRAAEDSDPLRAALAAAGFEPVALPLLAYETAPGSGSVGSTLAGYGGGWVALTSPRAVPALAAAWKPPAGIRVAAVGPVTAAALRSLGLEPDLLGNGDGAAGLVRAFAGLEEPTGPAARVLWLAGNLAGEDLRYGLKNLGYAVETLEVYRTVVLRPPADEVAAALDGLRGAVFASPSAVDALVAAAGREWVAGDGGALPVIAIGQTTEAALLRAGFRRRKVAAEPTPEGLARAAALALQECV